MKRLFSLLLVAVMLVSILSTMVSSAGTLIFSDYFDSGFSPKNWITDRETCAFEWDKEHQCIQGYEPARVLQSQYDKKFGRRWDQFYGKIDFQIRDFDDLEPAKEPHRVAIYYIDLFEHPDDIDEIIYYLNVEVETGRMYLEKQANNYRYYDENGVAQTNSVNCIIAEGQIEGKIEIGEDAPWYELGIRITSGKIEGYFNQQLVISCEAKADDEKVGHVAVNNVDSTVGTYAAPFILFSGKQGSANWIGLDNFEIWSADYDFVSVIYGDVNGDGNVNLSDISMMLQAIAKWDVQGYSADAGDVNGDGAVNLSDVSKTLQAIAKWEGVVLGPTA